jgi:uncharacterized protein
MGRFINRESELTALRRRLRRDSSLCLVYGQRRVGKTFLLQKLLQDDPDTVFFLGDETSSRALLGRFVNQIRESRPDLLPPGFNDGADWQTTLAVLFHSASTSNRRMVLVLDECQYLFAAANSLPSVLQRLWDEYSNRSRVHLLLCGSALGVLAGLGESNQPLHGRFDLKMKLSPFVCHESRLFASGWSPHDQFRLYGTFGGLARHLAVVDQSLSLGQNVCNEILDPLSALHEAPYDILRSEHFSSYADASAILEATAGGENRFNAIAARTGLKAARLDYVLKELLALELLTKETRFADRPGARFTRHECRDPFIAFWFRYVLPNRLAIQSTSPFRVWSERIEPLLDNYMGTIFQRVVRQAVLSGCLSRELGPVDEVGSYWSRDHKTEIDLIARGADCLVFIEVKWRKSQRVGLPALEQLRGHLNRCPLARTNRSKRLCIACNNGFTSALKKVAKEERIILLDADALGYSSS